MPQLTLYWDQRVPITVDREEFALIRMTIEECGAHEDLKNLSTAVGALVAQGYEKDRAKTLCIMARNHWREEYRN